MNKRTLALKKLIPNFNGEVKNFSTDTRTLQKGDFYIPLIGEKFDGHQFIKQALVKGAISFVYSHGNYENGYKVKDTLEFYQQLASYYRAILNSQVIAITGSTGKTTVKTIISKLLLNAAFSVYFTKENENNLIGVPKTILEAPEDSDILVIEMGTNKFGEIEKETLIAQPNIGILVNIGPSHLEFFGDLKGVFKEKRALIDYIIKHNGIGILPEWDKFSVFYKGKEQISFVDYEITSQNLIVKMNSTIAYKIPLCDLFKFYRENIAISLGIAKLFDLNQEQIIKALNNITFPRLKTYQIKDKKIIDDSYNANPISFSRGIEYISQKPGKKAIIIGQMLELGSHEKKYEEELFNNILKSNIDVVIVKEPMAASIPEEFITCKSNKEIIEILKEKWNDFDLLYIKGSHGTELFKLLPMLKEF